MTTKAPEPNSRKDKVAPHAKAWGNQDCENISCLLLNLRSRTKPLAAASVTLWLNVLTLANKQMCHLSDRGREEKNRLAVRGGYLRNSSSKFRRLQMSEHIRKGVIASHALRA